MQPKLLSTRSFVWCEPAVALRVESLPAENLPSVLSSSSLIARRGSRIAVSAAFAISCASDTTRGVACLLPASLGSRASARISLWIGWLWPSGDLISRA
eukprot:1289500-Prymnesium_polylepis.2